MIRLLFIRHGATAGNLEKRYIGKLDEPLCETGIAQIDALQKCNLQAGSLFVSPMLRTRQTAELLFPQLPYTLVHDLREIDFGVFEGKTAEELSDCPAYRKWVDSCCLAPIPQGEGVTEFKERCCRAFAEILKQLPDNSTAAFIVHGGTIMAILEAFAAPKKDFYAYHIGNGAMISACFQDGEITVRY